MPARVQGGGVASGGMRELIPTDVRTAVASQNACSHASARAGQRRGQLRHARANLARRAVAAQNPNRLLTCQRVAQGGGVASGGMRELIPTVARTAVAAGVDGIFMEVRLYPSAVRLCWHVCCMHFFCGIVVAPCSLCFAARCPSAPSRGAYL